MLDRKHFIETITGFCELLGRPPLSKPALEMYYRALKDLSVKDFDQAVDRLVKGRRFTTLPIPADFRAGLESSAEDQAVVAAEAILHRMRDAGGDADQTFDDPALMAAVELAGGWPFLCDYVNSFDLDKLGIWKREFAALYRTALTRRLPAPQVLLGRHSRDNIARGYLNPATGELKNAEGKVLRIMPWAQKQLEAGVEPAPPVDDEEGLRHIRALTANIGSETNVETTLGTTTNPREE